MASKMYNSGLVKLGDGSIDWNTDTIKLALVNNTYVPDIDAHDFFNDVTNELVATGYTAGGATLTAQVTQDNTNDRAIYDANDVQYASLASAVFRYAIVYKSTGVASTSPLICVIDLTGSGNQTVNGIYDLTFNAAGIFNLTNP